MASQLRQQIEQISREKNINAEIIIAAIEDAILTASKKYYRTEEDLRSRFNDETGQIEVFAVRQVVEKVEDALTQIGVEEARGLIPEAELGSEIEFPKPTDVLGRIAAQTAKQVIFQKVREAERDNVFAEYSGRVGDVINGIVKRQEMGDLVLDIGRAEAVLPRKEQSRAEAYQIGDRVRVVISKVMKAAKGPQVVVSRTDPALLIKLFEMEVPEIYDGTVMIRGCVRESGERAKIAVLSREKDVDPVGACVGMKGTRVQSIIRELRGEKIDIVEWSEDSVAFVEKALSPAKVSRVAIVDEEQRIMEVVVEDKQLSLAIGKKGQNVRLAAKLVGWRIDIKSEEEKRQEVEAEMARMARIVAELRSLEGVGDKTIQKLIDHGIGGLTHLLEMSDDDICLIEGVGLKTAERIREAATKAKAEWDRRDAEEAARLAAEQAALAATSSESENPPEEDGGASTVHAAIADSDAQGVEVVDEEAKPVVEEAERLAAEQAAMAATSSGSENPPEEDGGAST
ncbi:MAG: transcription termination/antitermination protein NusA, partial [Vicinamibacteria bacterium]|nr:transcription termination/antitermination protein NusA [Vicinamibacteria bacterium]